MSCWSVLEVNHTTRYWRKARPSYHIKGHCDSSPVYISCISLVPGMNALLIPLGYQLMAASLKPIPSCSNLVNETTDPLALPRWM